MGPNWGSVAMGSGLSWLPASEGRNRIRSTSQMRLLLMACFNYICPFRKRFLLHLFSLYFHEKLSKALQWLSSHLSLSRGEKSPVRPGDNGERVRLPGGVAASWLAGLPPTPGQPATRQTRPRLVGSGYVPIASCTAKTQYQTFETNIPKKGIAWRASPNFLIHVSVSDLYIPMIGLPIPSWGKYMVRS